VPLPSTRVVSVPHGRFRHKSWSTAGVPPGIANVICRHTVIILILFLGTIGVYAQVRHYRYIDYDDDRHVRENQYV